MFFEWSSFESLKKPLYLFIVLLNLSLGLEPLTCFDPSVYTPEVGMSMVYLENSEGKIPSIDILGSPTSRFVLCMVPADFSILEAMRSRERFDSELEELTLTCL